jgi:hypothetical protein
MTDDLDLRIAAARERAADHAVVAERLHAARTRLGARRTRLAALEKRLQREEADVERLEGFSVDGVLAALRGTKDERLARERVEAAHAALAYEACREQLTAMEGAERQLAETAERLAGADAELAGLLRQSEARIIAADAPAGRRLLEIARLLAEATSALREISEAMAAAGAARSALSALGLALRRYDDALPMVFLGGGRPAGEALLHEMTAMRRHAPAAQRAIDRLVREAADLHAVRDRVRALGLADLTSFTDAVLDAMVEDWLVVGEASRSRRSVAAVLKVVAGVRAALVAGRDELSAAVARLEAERGSLRT